MKYLMRWPTCVFPIYRARLLCVRFQSTKTAPAKSFNDIVSEINAKAANRTRFKHHSIKTPPFSKHDVRKERYKQIKCGDVVLVNLEPLVVVKTPTSPLDSYVLSNRVGKTKEVFLPSIDARLFSLLPESAFANKDIYSKDDCVATNVNSIDDESLREEEVSQPLVKVVDLWLYNLIFKPLSDLFEEASAHAHRSFKSVVSTIDQLRKDDEAVIIPFSEFVEKCMQRRMSVTDFYAVLLCLDHITLQQTFQLRISYVGGVDAIQLLPRNIERRNLETLSSTSTDIDENMEFLQDYARNNLPSGIGEARAIEIMRKNYPDLSYIDNAITSENLLEGGVFYRGNNWLEWVFKDAQKREGSENVKYLTSVEAGDYDKLEHRRSPFNRTVYCIDELGSHEIDDGISLEPLSDNKVRLGIHIANPTSGMNLKKGIYDILPHSSSVYLHDVTFKLLPESFTKKYSLTEGKEYPVLSLFVTLDLSNGALSDVDVKAHTLTNIKCIEPAKFVSGGDIENYPLFEKAAEILFEKRLRNGMITFKDYLQPERKSKELAFQNMGKAVTTEFMILANMASAQYAKDHNIPLWFRHQHILLQSEEIRKMYRNEVTKNGGLVDASWQSVIRRSNVGVVPRKHMGMGVDIATRFTSPLRRLEDLVTHHQLEAHIMKNDKLLFSVDELDSMSEKLFLSESIVKEIHRSDQRYVGLKSLQPGKKELGIVFSNTMTLNSKIYLPEHKVDAIYTGDKLFKPYSVHEFTVDRVSPAGGYATVH